MQEKLSTFAVQMAATSGQLGPNLVSARKGARLTQAELAQRLQVNLSTYIRWEHGKATPRWHNLERLADVLKIDIADLLDSEDPSASEAPTLSEEIAMLRADVAAMRTELAAVIDIFTNADQLASALARRDEAGDPGGGSTRRAPLADVRPPSKAPKSRRPA